MNVFGIALKLYMWHSIWEDGYKEGKDKPTKNRDQESENAAKDSDNKLKYDYAAEK